MNTVTLSPRRQLEAFIAARRGPMASGRTLNAATAFMNMVGFKIGQRVTRRDNPRHVGTVDGIQSTGDVNVEWDNGWKEVIDHRELRRAS